jgi:RNA polymerase sigma factor for flagellar operon FliA
MHKALATYATAKIDAADLLQQYGSLIDRTARRLVVRTGLSSAYDDLWSAGALGLLEAARRFDSAKGAGFETFVGHRIRGAMLDELRRLDHLPRRLRSRTDEVEKARRNLAAKLGRDATSAEVASELELDASDLADIEALGEAPIPLESIIATLPGEWQGAGGIDDEMDRTRRLHALTDAMTRIPERLQILLSLHYVEGLSYREIGRIMDISQPRVCQLHADALKHLRSALGGVDDSDRGGAAKGGQMP